MIETYTEEQAAGVLFKGHPPDKALRAIKRLRYKKKIDCIKVGHVVSYTEQQLLDFMVGTCRKNTQSEISGSQKEKAVKPGTSPGMTAKPDKRALSLVARQTFKKQKS